MPFAVDVIIHWKIITLMLLHNKGCTVQLFSTVALQQEGCKFDSHLELLCTALACFSVLCTNQKHACWVVKRQNDRWLLAVIAGDTLRSLQLHQVRKGNRIDEYTTKIWLTLDYKMTCWSLSRQLSNLSKTAAENLSIFLQFSPNFESPACFRLSQLVVMLPWGAAGRDAVK